MYQCGIPGEDIVRSLTQLKAPFGWSIKRMPFGWITTMNLS